MNRVIVIGGSSGVGAEIAEQLVQRGDVVVTMQRRVAQFATVALDLRWDFGVVKREVYQAANDYEADALIVSGGVGAFTEPLMGDDIAEEIVKTNHTGAVACFQGWLRSWMKRGEYKTGATGRAIYIGSSSERNRARGIELYASSKAAGSKYFIEAGRRYASRGVRSGVVEAGWFDSPMTAEIVPEMRERIVRGIPIGRVSLLKEVAEVVLQQLDAPDSVTGNVYQITGGL